MYMWGITERYYGTGRRNENANDEGAEVMAGEVSRCCPAVKATHSWQLGVAIPSRSKYGHSHTAGG